jgi:tetratricopeptide (TPR) repeat protein
MKTRIETAEKRALVEQIERLLNSVEEYTKQRDYVLALKKLQEAKSLDLEHDLEYFEPEELEAKERGLEEILFNIIRKYSLLGHEYRRAEEAILALENLQEAWRLSTESGLNILPNSTLELISDLKNKIQLEPVRSPVTYRVMRVIRRITEIYKEFRDCLLKLPSFTVGLQEVTRQTVLDIRAGFAAVFREERNDASPINPLINRFRTFDGGAVPPTTITGSRDALVASYIDQDAQIQGKETARGYLVQANRHLDEQDYEQEAEARENQIRVLEELGIPVNDFHYEDLILAYQKLGWLDKAKSTEARRLKNKKLLELEASKQEERLEFERYITDLWAYVKTHCTNKDENGDKNTNWKEVVNELDRFIRIIESNPSQLLNFSTLTDEERVKIEEASDYNLYTLAVLTILVDDYTSEIVIMRLNILKRDYM